jgi:hypothetical protein
MDICRTTVPQLAPTGESGHLQACHLDEATKEREAARLLGAVAEVS